MTWKVPFLFSSRGEIGSDSSIIFSDGASAEDRNHSRRRVVLSLLVPSIMTRLGDLSRRSPTWMNFLPGIPIEGTPDPDWDVGKLGNKIPEFV